MNRKEHVDKIINGEAFVTANHVFRDDILFYLLLKEAAVEKEWYEVADFCDIQITHIKNKSDIGKLIK